MANYYVATPANGGNNSNPGTLASPWATWQKGFSTIIPGDICYIRGGTYTPTATAGTGDGGSYLCGVYIPAKHGTAGGNYQVYNYPGEVPIMDASALGTSDNKCGVLLNSSNYWHVKGLEIKNATQNPSPAYGGTGFQLYGGNNNLIENCVSHHNGGPGFNTRVPDGNGNTFLNCDAYSNYDPYSSTPGDNADGFDIGFSLNDYHIWLIGCRSWNNSDDGYDEYQYANYSGIYHMINCWAWHNGYRPGTSTPAGDGNGFKLGLDNQVYSGATKRYLYNCIAYNNRQRGFSQESARVKKEFYNCISKSNGSWGFSFGWTGDSSGFEVGDILRNCVAAGDGVENLHGGTMYALRISDHNSWSGGVTVTDADFVSVNGSELAAARQSDGSLPVINFLHLAIGSDLKYAGSATGIYGADGDRNAWHTPPSMGAFEFGVITPPASVPNTATFSLQDVVDVVNPTTNDLVDCFADAGATMFSSIHTNGFDSLYEGNHDRLYNFRNYTLGITSDWFLPSRDELNAMYTQLYLYGLGGFSNDFYWSSSEGAGAYSAEYAWEQTFETGIQYHAYKSDHVLVYVRACRAFTSATVYNLRDVGPAGGRIFWKSGNNYLEAASTDQSTSQAWSNIINVAIGASAQGTAIGTGQANTTAIINQAGHTTSAAKLCNDLVT